MSHTRADSLDTVVCLQDLALCNKSLNQLPFRPKAGELPVLMFQFQICARSAQYTKRSLSGRAHVILSDPEGHMLYRNLLSASGDDFA